MRASGILLHISSLPSPHGIGTMGAAAKDFVDFLVKAGQAYWQILPVCPTSYGDSPYQSFSTFAGNPYFIDLDLLAKAGLLQPEEYESIDWESTPGCVNYGALYQKRYVVLHKACARLLAAPPADYADFLAKNAFWLPDYALFMALKDAHNGVCWQQWEEPLRRREPETLAAARASAPPMLPVPINPYVMVCTSFPFFPIIIHPLPERNRKKAARVREKPSRNQLRNGFCYVSMV